MSIVLISVIGLTLIWLISRFTKSPAELEAARRRRQEPDEYADVFSRPLPPWSLDSGHGVQERDRERWLVG